MANLTPEPPRDAQQTGLRQFVGRWIDALPGVAANLTTIFAAFLFSLLFAPVRQALGLQPSHDYPLVCFADAVKDGDGPGLRAEVFIANPTSEDYSATELQDILNRDYAGSNIKAVVTIPLKFDPSQASDGASVSVVRDDDFNGPPNAEGGKGEILIHQLKNDVFLTVKYIAAHSVLRAVITVSDVPDVAGKEISRLGDRNMIPFDVARLKENCFGT